MSEGVRRVEDGPAVRHDFEDFFAELLSCTIEGSNLSVVTFGCTHCRDQSCGAQIWNGCASEARTGHHNSVPNF